MFKSGKWIVSIFVLVCLFAGGCSWLTRPIPGDNNGDNGEPGETPMASWEINEQAQFVENGLFLVQNDYDGKYSITAKGGKPAVETELGSGWMFLYFAVDDGILYEPPNGTPIRIQVEYYDEGGSDEYFALNQISWATDDFYWTETVYKESTNEWKVYEFVITDGKFNSAGPGGSDFRIQAGDFKLAIRRVAIFLGEEEAL